MTTLTHVLDGLAVLGVSIVGRGVFLLIWPYRPCRWCRPGGLVGGSIAGQLAGVERERKRRRSCWRCKGERLTRRLGARTAHHVKLVLTAAWTEWRDGE